MGPLKNIRREKFCQGIVSGLSQTKAYTAAGYSERGAKQSAARLLNNADVRSRVSELRQEIESSFVRLQITERLQRLDAIQDRWDALREAKRCFAKGDFEGAMKTGVVCRKKRWIGGKDGYEVTEYEINTALIECLNSVEKRAAIETGQEVDRSDISLRGGLAAQAEMLRKAFTLEELEIMDAKMEAAMNGSPKLIEAPVALAGEKKQEKPTSSPSESSFGRATPGKDVVVDTTNGVNGKESWRS
jgi:hypothetical protein